MAETKRSHLKYSSNWACAEGLHAKHHRGQEPDLSYRTGPIRCGNIQILRKRTHGSPPSNGEHGFARFSHFGSWTQVGGPVMRKTSFFLPLVCGRQPPNGIHSGTVAGDHPPSLGVPRVSTLPYSLKCGRAPQSIETCGDC
jgi:hypothetical protein